MPERPRQLHINVNILQAGVFGGSWRFPGTDPLSSYRLDHYLRVAQKAEAALLDAVFLADGAAIRDNIRYRPTSSLEPTIVLTAIARVTERIGLIGALSSSFNDPFNVARRLATLDQLSGGRAGWDVVTTADEASARNFGLDQPAEHGLRYEIAAEFVEVVRALWRSWEPGALIADRDRGVFADTSKIHAIDHRGAHFTVAGPLNVPRSPQGEPVIVQADAPEDGRALAARIGEVIFTAADTKAAAQEYYLDVKSRAVAFGRRPDEILILPGLSTVVGSTDAEVRQRRELLRRLGGGMGHRIVAGRPEQIADTMIDWLDHGAADGFNVLPEGFDDFADQVIPELQRRGRFRTAYEGTTLRQHLGLREPDYSRPGKETIYE
ncbi:MAG: NtaA/DmoA family FMN-dependent monooxygenase [Streptosporangiaceae bacterium]|jgi:FMN-dependent oxidoreductase (nitrilotriacetate monooxygenase family)